MNFEQRMSMAEEARDNKSPDVPEARNNEHADQSSYDAEQMSAAREQIMSKKAEQAKLDAEQLAEIRKILESSDANIDSQKADAKMEQKGQQLMKDYQQLIKPLLDNVTNRLFDRVYTENELGKHSNFFSELAKNPMALKKVIEDVKSIDWRAGNLQIPHPTEFNQRISLSKLEQFLPKE